MKALLTVFFFVLSFSASAQYIGMSHDVSGQRPRPGTDTVPLPTPHAKPPTVEMPGTYYPQTFAAIAFSQYTGGIGHSAGYLTEAEASMAALNYCGGYCQVIAVARGAHIALAVGRRNGFGYAISGRSMEEAREEALRNCRQQTRNCKIRAYTSSGHQVY